MKIREPIPHWNNFTIPDLKAILKHCEALERLGIAQDGEMMNSVKRDITLRERKMSLQHEHPQLKTIKTIQIRSINHQVDKKKSLDTKQHPQELLLEQTS